MRGAGADRRDVEAECRSRQQPHIGEHRIASAHTRIVLQHGDAEFVEQHAQPRALAALGGLGDAEEQIGDTGREARVAHGRERGRGLHQGLAGAAGLRDRDEARGRQRQLGEQRGVALGIEIIHEMQVRRRP